ncbi:MAG: DUF2066 domain-containing protein [Pseudomonadota bacterium]
MHAATVDNLYSSSVAVTGQDALERRRGFRLALESVLVKLTGDGAVATLPQLETLMRNAQTHVAQFRYVSLERPGAGSTEDNAQSGADRSGSAELTPITPTSAEPTHILDVTFVEASLNRALNDIGLPLWGAERPETLLWLAVQERSRRYILASGGNSAVQISLDQVARKRALPVLLPLMDLQDQAAVKFSDVRGGFSGRVQDASARYEVNTVLTGSLRDLGNGWTARWVLYSGNRLFEWQARGATIDDVLTVGMEGLANQLASRFSIAVNYSQSSVLNIRVDDIDSLDDYARVLAYLEGLAVVERVNVERIEANVGYFRLNTLGDLADLRSAVALNTVLLPAEDEVASASQDAAIHYSLVP